LRGSSLLQRARTARLNLIQVADLEVFTGPT
jgi:hypothetical protein